MMVSINSIVGLTSRLGFKVMLDGDPNLKIYGETLAKFLTIFYFYKLKNTNFTSYCHHHNNN